MKKMFNIRGETTFLYQELNSKSERGVQRKECLNENILTQERVVVQPANLPREHSKLKTKISERFKSFHFTQMKRSSASRGNLTVPLPEGEPGDAGWAEHASDMFGEVCAAHDLDTVHTEESSHAGIRIEKLQVQLNKMQKQMSKLTKELDHVHSEKLDLVILLEKLMRSAESKTGLDNAKLEKVRTFLTAAEGTIIRSESTLTDHHIDMNWFCSPCTGSYDGR